MHDLRQPLSEQLAEDFCDLIAKAGGRSVEYLRSAASPEAFSGQLPICDKFAASWISFSEPEVPEFQRLSADG